MSRAWPLFLLLSGCLVARAQALPDDLVGQSQASVARECKKVETGRRSLLPIALGSLTPTIDYCQLKHPAKTQFGAEVKKEIVFFDRSQVIEVKLVFKSGQPLSDLFAAYGPSDSEKPKPSIEYSPVAGTLDLDRTDGSHVSAGEYGASESKTLWWTQIKGKPELGISYYFSSSRNYASGHTWENNEVVFFRQKP